MVMESMVDADELMAYQGVVNLRIFYIFDDNIHPRTCWREHLQLTPHIWREENTCFWWRCSRKPLHCHIYWWYPHQISPFYPISIISSCEIHGFNMFQHGNALKAMGFQPYKPPQGSSWRSWTARPRSSAFRCSSMRSLAKDGWMGNAWEGHHEIWGFYGDFMGVWMDFHLVLWLDHRNIVGHIH